MSVSLRLDRVYDGFRGKVRDTHVSTSPSAPTFVSEQLDSESESCREREISLWLLRFFSNRSRKLVPTRNCPSVGSLDADMLYNRPNRAEHQSVGIARGDQFVFASFAFSSSKLAALIQLRIANDRNRSRAEIHRGAGRLFLGHSFNFDSTGIRHDRNPGRKESEFIRPHFLESPLHALRVREGSQRYRLDPNSQRKGRPIVSPYVRF